MTTTLNAGAASGSTTPQNNDAEVKDVQPVSFVVENLPKFYNSKRVQAYMVGTLKIAGISQITKHKNQTWGIFTFKDRESKEAAFEALDGKKYERGRMQCRQINAKDLQRKRKREQDDGRAVKRRSQTLNVEGFWENVGRISGGGTCSLTGCKDALVQVKDKGKRWILYSTSGTVTSGDCLFRPSMENSRMAAEIDFFQNNGTGSRQRRLGTVFAQSAGELLVALNKKEGGERPSLATVSAAESTEKKSSDEVIQTKLRRARNARNVTTPYWRVPYEEQLRLKDIEARSHIKRLARQLTKLYWKFDGGKRPMGGGRLSVVEKICPSPALEGYRNKCEFTAGTDVLTGQPMFGFTVGSIRERVKDGDEKLGEIGSGCANVADPSLCTHVPRVAIEVAERMTAFMRSTSLKHKCYDRIIGEGVFRQVMVRNSQSTKEALVVVQIKSEGLQKSELDAIRNGLLQVCEQLNEGWAAAATKKGNDDGGSNDKEIEQSSGTASSNGGDEESSRSCYRIVSALIQYNETRFEVNCDSKTEVIFGPGNFHESLLGVRFCVSPEAFFQINAKAAECLFETVRDWVSNPVPYPDEKKEEEGADGEVVETEQPVPTLKSDAKDSSTGSSTMASSPPVILDVCCGTGAIGLLLAKSAKMIYGLEIVAEAIEDAKRNAEINKIDNVKYYVGKVRRRSRK
eukprot:jgi/Bigna1/86323/estExt_fgenesh1_pg.C_90297